jgi:hypothetical protein
VSDLDVRQRHLNLTETAPDEIEIAGTKYTMRKFTPKRKGEPVGHGWVRNVAWASSASGRSEVGAEAVNLIDEIVTLRAENAELRAQLEMAMETE